MEAVEKVARKLCIKCNQIKPLTDFRGLTGHPLCQHCEDVEAEQHLRQGEIYEHHTDAGVLGVGDLEDEGFYSVKKCNKCGEYKSLDNFYLHSLSGIQSQCKQCQNEHSYRICKICRQRKTLEHNYYRRERNDGSFYYWLICKDCTKKASLKRMENNKRL